MVTPSHFYAPSNFASFDAAFGLVRPCVNKHLDSITKEDVGSSFFEIFHTFAPIVCKVQTLNKFGDYENVGTGGFITNNLFVTAAHIFEHTGAKIRVQTFGGDFIDLEKSLINLDFANDVAFFEISAPSSITHFPKLISHHDSSMDLGMIHFGSGSIKPLVSVGSMSYESLSELTSLIDIDGASGASGGFVFDSRGHLVFMNLARELGFSTLRTQAKLKELIDHLLPGITKPASPILQRVPEHGFLSTTMQKDSGHKSTIPIRAITRREFQKARNLIFDVLKKWPLDFYSRAFQRIDRLFTHEDGSHVRIDVQDPMPTFTNVAIQIGDYTVGSIHIPIILKHFSESKPAHLAVIKSIVKYSLGHLLMALSYAEKNNKTITYKISFNNSSHFKLYKLINKEIDD